MARTKSAVEHIFQGIDYYVGILRDAFTAPFVGSFPSKEEMEQELKKWAAENETIIRRSLEAQRSFQAEKYALATLCGALLQVATTAIKIYSMQSRIPGPYLSLIGVRSGLARYCLGREVRGVPIGLIIYAGRNQYSHIDDQDLHPDNRKIFEYLATNHSYGKGIRDPAFDLNIGAVWNYPSNITSLLGWRTYQAYDKDVRELFSGTQ